MNFLKDFSSFPGEVIQKTKLKRSKMNSNSGVLSSTSGRSDFGGLGSLDLPALAAHLQIGTFRSKKNIQYYFIEILYFMLLLEKSEKNYYSSILS